VASGDGQNTMNEKESNNSILIVLRVLFRWGIKTLMFLLLIGLTVWAGIWAYYEVTEGIPSRQVAVDIRYLQEPCGSKEYPVYVKITNNSNRTVLSYDLYLIARKIGYSKNVAADYESISSDKILKPGDFDMNCWRIKRRKVELDESMFLNDEGIEVLQDGNKFFVNFED
jgi:hypothetical protein